MPGIGPEAGDTDLSRTRSCKVLLVEWWRQVNSDHSMRGDKRYQRESSTRKAEMNHKKKGWEGISGRRNAGAKSWTQERM